MIIKKLKLEEILITLFPFLIITGPAIPDISAVIIICIFIYKIFKNKNFKINKNYWIYIFILLNLWFIFISFFSFNFKLSIIDSIIFARFIIFIIAVTYFIQSNENLLKYILYSIFLAIIFVTIDTLFQFYNYSSEEGFKSDLFGIKEKGLYGRLNGPFNDYIPGSYLSRFYFFILLILFINKKFIKNKYILSFFSISLSIILSTIFFTGEPMAVCTTLLGLFIISIFLKNYRKIILTIIVLSSIIILVNKLFHPFYNDYKILNNSSLHEGLVIEKSFKCNDNSLKTCSKIFHKQPSILTTLRNFKDSPYGEIYITALQMWKNNKITGIGLNNFQEVCKKTKKYEKFNKNFGCGVHPHNFYIQALTESGLPGFIIFTCLIFSWIYKFKNFNKNHYKIIGLIILITIFWPIMSTGSFLKNGNMIFISFLLGIILGIKSSLITINE